MTIQGAYWVSIRIYRVQLSFETYLLMVSAPWAAIAVATFNLRPSFKTSYRVSCREVPVRVTYTSTFINLYLFTTHSSQLQYPHLVLVTLSEMSAPRRQQHIAFTHIPALDDQLTYTSLVGIEDSQTEPKAQNLRPNVLGQ